MFAHWRLTDVAPGDGDLSRLTRGGGDRWVDVTAPGDTYLALVAAGRLAHPYRGRGEDAAEWVRHREWWWHTKIEIPRAPSETMELVFEGLDTFADIYLDGALLGRANNMFRTWRFSVSDHGDGATHDLAVCFHPPSRVLDGEPLPVWGAFTDRISKSRRTLVRKAQFGWGWDWGPDLPTVGIWKPVRLERSSGAAITSLGFTTIFASERHAQVRVDVELSGDAEISLELRAPGGAIVASARRRGAGAVTLDVDQPQLWWTHDLGAQPLYALTARTPNGAELSRQIGIRTIAIDQSADPDEPGASFFRFVLNGVHIFARGVCWVPASSFVAAIEAERYRDLLERAVIANMNMIRVWGGGIYEPEVFYEECDRLGLLVWQDFMFACAPYPGDDPAFRENVRQEVIEQVRRLRTHPSLALWCGNNENQALQYFNNLREAEDHALTGLNLYEQLIPEVLKDTDPDRPYWPSSPWGGATPNSMTAGDVHNWTVWHGIPLIPDDRPTGAFDTSPDGVAFTRYAEDMSRFVSEFGVQAAPDIATLERWMAPEDLNLHSQGFLDRIKDIADKATSMMLPVTGAATTLADYIDFTMITQAEAMKFGIEHFRRRKPHCSGALIWQYNDCWPCVSWSLIDYDGVAKQSYYTTRRAFAPVLASFRRTINDAGDDDALELWITNDTLQPIQGEAIVTLEYLRTGVDWTLAVPLDVGANSSAVVWRGNVAANPGQVLHVRSETNLFASNRFLLAPIKDLQLGADAELVVTQARVEGGSRIEIAATSYALAVRLRAADPRTRFSDNYFDLAASEKISVVVTHTANTPLGDIEVSAWNSRRLPIQG